MDGLPIEKSAEGRPTLRMDALFAPGGYVNGKWWPVSRDGKTFAVANKGDDRLLGQLPDFSAAETTEAVAAADAAGPGWAARTANERSAILKKWHQLIIENLDDLAAILTAEQGKPLAEARGEIAFGAAFVEWYAEEAKRVYGDFLPTYSNDRRIVVIRQPLGVVAAITPGIFPMAWSCASLRRQSPWDARSSSNRPRTRLTLALHWLFLPNAPAYLRAS